MRCIPLLGLLLAGIILSISGSHAEIVEKCSVDKPCTNITEVHLIFMNHMDVGFTLPLASSVIDEYLFQHFPRALKLIDESKSTSMPFKWNTQPYMIMHFLDDNRVSELNKARCIQALKDGYIQFHAFPINNELGITMKSGVESGFELVQQFADSLGIDRPLVMSQKDVPSISRGIVPIMARKGVKAIHIGANKASSTPELPDTFIWQDRVTMHSVLYALHPGGYGGPTVANDIPVALDFAFRGDNTGPPDNHGEVILAYNRMALTYPNAKVIASSFNDWYRAMQPYMDLLPVVENEIGDSWIYIFGTDPWRLAVTRRITMAREHLLESGDYDPISNPVFERELAKLTEHTIGADVKVYLADFTHWSNQDFAKERGIDPHFITIESSWQEQRQFIDLAIAGLTNTKLLAEIQEILSILQPSDDFLVDFNPTDAFNMTIASFDIDFENGTPHIKGFNDDHDEFFRIGYSTFDQDDYDQFFKDYNCFPGQTETPCPATWMTEDYGKPGCSKYASMSHTFSQVKAIQLYQSKISNTTVAVKYQFDADANPALRNYGPASVYYIIYEFSTAPTNTSILRIDSQVIWLGKQATRLPEATWLSFSPPFSYLPEIHKHTMGSRINVRDFAKRGGAWMTGIDQNGVEWSDGNWAFQVASPDIGLFSLRHNMLTTFLDSIDTRHGIHLNLHNNAWGTNAPQWYGDNYTAEVVVEIAQY